MADEYGFLDSIQAEVTELPKRSATGGGRQRAVQDNPFIQWVQESYDTNSGRSTTVQARHAVKAEYLIRQAAVDLGLGVRVVREVDGQSLTKDEVKELNANKKVKLLFQGQPKRAYSPRARRNQAPEIVE